MSLYKLTFSDTEAILGRNKASGIMVIHGEKLNIMCVPKGVKSRIRKSKLHFQVLLKLNLVVIP